MRIFQVPDWKQNRLVYTTMIAFATILVAIACQGCATGGGPRPNPGPVVANTFCALAQIEQGRCARGEETNRSRCDAADASVLVCAIGAQPGEQGLLGSTLKPGVGLTPRSTQTCWREFVGGPQKFGTGRLDVDPWSIAGMPGGGQGGLPCGIEAVNLAYKEAFGQVCLGPGAPLGGYCGGPSNEILRGAPPLLEWACRNRPDLIGSEGSSAWNCSPGGLDLLRLAAFAGGNQMLAAVRSAMPQDPPPPPPAPFCGDHHPDPGETCTNCPADLGPCPPEPDGKIDCSGLVLPAPGVPQSVEVLPSQLSTGLAVTVAVPCRGATVLPAPCPSRPLPCVPPSPIWIASNKRAASNLRVALTRATAMPASSSRTKLLANLRVAAREVENERILLALAAEMCVPDLSLTAEGLP